MALGESVGSQQGRVTGQRVLSVDGLPQVETSFQMAGTLLGIETQQMATYSSELQPGGHLFGQGQGVFMGAGGATATWRGQGAGSFDEQGGVSFRGAVYIQTAHEPWLRLNGIALVYEYSQDAEGNAETEFWEWS